MPTYDYLCLNCDHEFEEMQKFSASPLTSCPNCQTEKLQRKIGGGIGVSFSGSGFYCTDYGSQVKPEGSSKCCPCDKNK